MKLIAIFTGLVVAVMIFNHSSSDIKLSPREVNNKKIDIINNQFNLKLGYGPYIKVGGCKFDIKEVEFEADRDDALSERYEEVISACVNTIEVRE